MILQNINNVILDRAQNADMTEMLRTSLYQGCPVNILIPQIQVPIQVKVGERYLEKIKKEHVIDGGHFVSFNPLTPLSERRLPLRHTFVLQGSNALVQSGENPRVFKEQFDTFVFQNTRFERGLQTHVLPESHFMAIPYPRYFNESTVSASGLLLQQDESGLLGQDGQKAMPKHEFLQ